MVLGGYFATLARMRKPYPTDLSDAEWNYIEPHLPAPTGHGRPRTHSSSRDPQRHLLPPKERLPVAPAPSRLPQVAHRLPLLQEMAYRRDLGEDQPGYPRTPEGSLEEGSPAQRWRGGFPVGQEHRGGRRRARLRRRQEGQGPQAPLLVDTEGFVLKAKVHSAKVMDYEGIKTLLRRSGGAISPPPHLWVDAGYRGEDKGADWVRKDPGLERGSGGAPAKARPRRGVDGVGEGVGQRGRGRRLAETIAPQRLSGAASSVGGGADDRLDRPEQEDEQRLREVMCERGSVGVCCHDSPHDEAARPCLRTFHTVSKAKFREIHLPRTQVNMGGE